MKSSFCFISLILSSVARASCQQYTTEGIQADSVLLQTYDSLENIQGAACQEKNENTDYTKAYRIIIRNQKQFDNLTSLLIGAFYSGKRKIDVSIRGGVYFFKESHLNLQDLHYEGVSVRISGKDVVVVPHGWCLINGKDVPCKIDGESCFIDLKKETSVLPWGEMMYADSLVEVVDEPAKVCRLKCKQINGLSLKDNNVAYLSLTRWCRCYQYKIKEIRNGYVYFIAHDLMRDSVFSKPQYNVNYDFVVSKKFPRFRLAYVTDKEKINFINNKIVYKSGQLHLGNTSTFLSIKRSLLLSFSIEGIKFIGNKAGGAPLISIDSFQTKKIEFKNCSFVGQREAILLAKRTNNLYFHHNYVAQNYRYGVISDIYSKKTRITDNLFENNGLDLSSNRCVTCSGTDYYIAHNIFKNFGYCAISVGVLFYEKKDRLSTGIVEYNEMFYDKDYFDNAWKYTIMDSGAIYVWTQNDRAIIRYNYIHDYTGMDQNRGIFFDDGAHHFAAYGNVIINTLSCHAIDSRRVDGTEKGKNSNSFSVQNNTDNTIMYNITDGTIHMTGNENQPNNCKEGHNCFLLKDGKRKITHKYEQGMKNLDVMAKNEEICHLSYDRNGVVFSQEEMRKIAQMPVFDKLSGKYIRIKQ